MLGCALLVATLPVGFVVGGVLVLAVGITYRSVHLRASHHGR